MLIQFYRCELCHGVVAPWDVMERGGCPKCGGRRLRLTNLSFFEKVWQILRRPRVWRWKNVEMLA